MIVFFFFSSYFLPTKHNINKEILERKTKQKAKPIHFICLHNRSFSLLFPPEPSMKNERKKKSRNE